jgi:hypothetical protein
LSASSTTPSMRRVRAREYIALGWGVWPCKSAVSVSSLLMAWQSGPETLSHFQVRRARRAGCRAHTVTGSPPLHLTHHRPRRPPPTPLLPCTSLYCPLEDDDGEAVGRFLRRCWLCGMPRCMDR